jgi:hypothetical protein
MGPNEWDAVNQPESQRRKKNKSLVRGGSNPYLDRQRVSRPENILGSSTKMNIPATTKPSSGEWVGFAPDDVLNHKDHYSVLK